MAKNFRLYLILSQFKRINLAKIKIININNNSYYIKIIKSYYQNYLRNNNFIFIEKNSNIFEIVEL